MVLGMRPLAQTKQLSFDNKVGSGKSSVSSAGEKKQQKVLFCSAYQTGDCDEADVHKATMWGKSWVVRHICAKCWLTKKEMKNHREDSSACSE
jgi:hypothetical protein